MKNKKFILLPFIALLLTSCDFSFTSLTRTSKSDSEESGQSTGGITETPSESEASSVAQESAESSAPISSEEVSTSVSTSVDEREKDGLRLVWSDEFDGDSLKKQNWTPMLGDGSDYGIYGWGNSEKQWYTEREDNVRVENGNLVITAIRENMRNMNYTSARIRSAGKVSTKYGYIEARIKLPEITGLWPAFWMMPEYGTPYGGWPNSGEIDIMEAKGRIPNSITAALHYGGNPQNNGGASQYRWGMYEFPDSTIGEYHTYALSWQEELIEWLVDDNVFFMMRPGPRGGWYSGSSDEYLAPFDQPFHILLNMAVGGHFDEHRLPPNNFDYAEMFVDYVRIYDFL